ncbi:MAG: hypothetical protein QOH72_2429 [Solirubrobacteraceae bacterium]|nr:hypothetical protein [Solirubrobacteraceae bacterium]
MYDKPLKTANRSCGRGHATPIAGSWVIACFCGQVYKGPMCPGCGARTPGGASAIAGSATA